MLIIDGTLCLPQNWMFAHMRKALGIDDKIDILSYIESLPTLQEQRVAHAKIEKVEEDAMQKMVFVFKCLHYSVLDCTRRAVWSHEGNGQILRNAELQFLKGRGLPTAICTRNNLRPVEYLIENFLPEHTFDPVGFC